MQYEKYGKPGSPYFDPNSQSVGVEAWKAMLEERDMLQAGWHQPEMIAELQKCEDFESKDLIGRAHATAQMKGYGYIALFGVKYHAALAHVERKWMMLKRAIRPKLDGKLPTLKRLIKDAWSGYTLDDARKSARHCRVSMNAYMKLGGTDLDLLRTEELKMKGHWRVFDSVAGRFVMKAGLQQTTKQRLDALCTEKARLNRLVKEGYDNGRELDWKSMLKRKARYDINNEVRIERDWDTKVRKANSLMRQHLVGEPISEKPLKWATNVLNTCHDG